jgi:two-component system, chemotaxis family, chemotaxis protein CheY
MSYNVLVVDDSAVMRGMIIKSLRLSGLPVEEIYQAGNGADGLRAIAEHRVDLALVDINMPVMNGEEMVERVRGNPATAGLPIIVVSTESSESRIESFESRGARFIHKPFDPAAFRAVVRDLTGGESDEQFEDCDLPDGGGDF